MKNGKPTIQELTAKIDELEKKLAKTEWLNEKENAEQALKRSEEKYKSLFENLTDEVHLWEIIKDKNGKIKTWKLVEANPVALKLWKKTRQEAIGKTPDEIFGIEAIKQFMPIVAKIFKTGKPYRWEQYFQPTNQYLSMDSIPFGNYFISTGRDVSEEKQMELKIKAQNKELQKTQILLESSLESPKDLIILSVDENYNYLYFNKAHKKVMKTAYNKEVKVAMNLLDCITDENDIKKTKINFGKALQGISHSTIEEFGEKNKSYYETFYNPIFNEKNEIIGATAFARNITERKRNEQEIKIKNEELQIAKEKAEKSEANVTAIIEGTINSIWAFDREYKIIFINHVFQQDFHQSFGVRLTSGMNLLEALPEPLQPIWKLRYDRVLTNEQFTIEDTVPTDAGTLYIEVTFNPIIKNGKVIGGSCFGSNITSRKQAEKELQESKLFADKIVNIVPALLFIYDFEKEKNIWTNVVHKQYFKEITESYPEMNFQSIAEIIHKDDFRKVYEKSMEMVEESSKNGYEIDIRVKSIDESWKWMNLRISEFKRDENGKLTQSLGALFDISDRKRIEEELIKAKEIAEESEIKLIEAQEISHVGSFEYIVETDTVTWSKELFRIFGRSTDLPAPQYSEQKPFYTKESFEKLDKAVQDSISKGIPYEIELDIITCKGDKKQIISKANAIKDANNKIIGCYGTAQDITDRKKIEKELVEAKEKAEEKEKQLRLISDNFVNGMIYQVAMLDENRRKFNYISKNVKELYGCTAEEAKKDPNLIYNKIHTDDIEGLITKEKKALKKMSVFETEARTIAPNGKIRWAYYISQPRIINGIVCWDGIEIDITERKKMELEIVKAKELAEEADRLKSAFLANMSHEIRTPMNGILGFTNLLQEHDLSGEQQQQYVEIIQKSGNRMLNTVNDIIEISRIEAGYIEVSSSEVNISDHLLTLHIFFSLEAEKNGLTLTIENKLSENESLIITDKNKLSSILTNLIKNAIKFTKKGNIEIGCKKNAEFMEFYVKDTGIGIPAERQIAIFNRFEQADIEDKHVHEGSGLGLAIVKSYVEMLGGNIWVESEENKGSTFFFTISCKPANSATVKKNSDK